MAHSVNSQLFADDSSSSDESGYNSSSSDESFDSNKQNNNNKYPWESLFDYLVDKKSDNDENQKTSDDDDDDVYVVDNDDVDSDDDVDDDSDDEYDDDDDDDEYDDDSDDDEYDDDSDDEYDDEDDEDEDDEDEDDEDDDDEDDEDKNDDEDEDEDTEDKDEEIGLSPYKMAEYNDLNDDENDENEVNDDEDEDDDEDTDDQMIVDETFEDTNEPSIIHNVSQLPFFYALETKEDPTVSSIIINTDKDTLDYQLFFYILVNNRVYPYILCLLEYRDNYYRFPTIQYTPYATKPNENDDKDIHAISINNLCFSQVAEIFSIKEEEMNEDDIVDDDEYVMKRIVDYKSNHYIPIRTDKYVKYLQYQPNRPNTLSDWFFSQSSKSKYVWCTVDEIMRKKQIFDVPIYPIISELFTENPLFHTIENNERKTIETPRTMFACTWSPKKKEFQTIEIAKSELTMSEYDFYGPMYFFCDDILNSAKRNVKTIPRYAVFEGEYSMVNDGSKETTKKLEVTDVFYSSVRFSYKNTTIQGVVSPEFFYEF